MRHWLSAGRTGAVVLVLALCLAACGGGDDDQTAYSFAVLGCNRVSATEVASALPSTANLAQLERSFAEIAAAQPPPQIVFFTGESGRGTGAGRVLLSSFGRDFDAHDYLAPSPPQQYPTTLRDAADLTAP